MNIPGGFKLLEVLRDDQCVFFARAQHRENNTLALLLVNKLAMPNRLYRGDGVSLAVPEPAHCLKLIDTLSYDGIAFRVFEDVGGLLLSSEMRLVQSDTDQQLRRARELCLLASRMVEQDISIHHFCPSNIMVADSRLILVDIANKENLQLSDEEQIICPPELLMLAIPERLDSSFVYALGAVIFQLFQQKPHIAVAVNVNAIRALSSKNSNLHKLSIDVKFQGLHALLVHALAARPEDRYQSIAAFAFNLTVLTKRYQRHGRLDKLESRVERYTGVLKTAMSSYGKQTVLDEVIEIINPQQKMRLIVVQGPLGIGKNFTVNEFKKRFTSYAWLTLDYSLHSGEMFATAINTAEMMLRQLSMKQQDAAVFDALWLVIDQLLDAPLRLSKQTLKFNYNTAVYRSADSDIDVSQIEYYTAKMKQYFLQIYAVLFQGLDWMVYLHNADAIDSQSAELFVQLSLKEKMGRSWIILSNNSKQSLFEDPVHNIRMTGWCEDDSIRFITDLLDAPCENAESFYRLIFRKSGGTPLFIKRLLANTLAQGMLSFDYKAMKFRVDLDRFSQYETPEDVVGFLFQSFRELPFAERAFICHAVCFFTDITPQLLAEISDMSEQQISRSLDQYCRAGLLLRLSGDEAYMFASSELKQKIYVNTAMPDRQNTHFLLAKALLREEPKLLKESLRISDHLFECIDLVQEEDAKRFAGILESRANACLLGAEYESSSRYFRLFQILVERYPSLISNAAKRRLHKTMAESCCSCQDYLGLKTQVEKFMAYDLDLSERVAMRIIEAKYFVMVGRHDDALEIAYRCLQDVGEPVPTDVDNEQVRSGISNLLDYYDIASISRQQFSDGCSDLEIVLVVQILEAVLGSLLVRNPLGMSLMIVRVVGRMYASRQFASCPALLTTLGIVVIRYTEFWALGRSLGRVGLELAEQDVNSLQKNRVVARYCHAIRQLQYPIASSLPILEAAMLDARGRGDLEYAAINSEILCINAFVSGQNLPQIRQKISWVMEEAIASKQTIIEARLVSLADLVKCIVEGPSRIEAEDLSAFNPQEYLCFRSESESRLPMVGDALGYPKIFCYQAIGHYLLDNRPRVIKVAELALFNTANPPRTTLYMLFEYFHGLSLFIEAVQNSDDEKYAARLNKAEQILHLYQQYSEHAPHNYLGKYLCLMAAKHFLDKDKWQTWRRISEAMAYANESNNAFDQAMMIELAFKFWAREGDVKLASNFLDAAIVAYSQWGADFKVEQLRSQQAQKLLIADWRGIAAPYEVVRSLDKQSLIDAHRVVTTEVEMGAIVEGLLMVLLDNSGADKVSLIIKDEMDIDQFYSLHPIGDNQLFLGPLVLSEQDEIDAENRVFKLVSDSRCTMVCMDVADDMSICEDPYLKKNEVLSLAVAPIFLKGVYKGLISLTSSRFRGLFSEQTVEVLAMLISQVSFALENAKMYGQLRNYSEDLESQISLRTMELESTISSLNQTRKKLVESEKLSALGLLVAGVAHEINTPLGICLTTNSHIHDSAVGLNSALSSGRLDQPSLEKNITMQIKASQLIDSNLRRMNDLVVRFKQINERRGGVQTRFNLRRAIDLIFTKFEQNAEYAAIEFYNQVDSGIIIESYVEIVDNIVSSLVENAFQHGFVQMETPFEISMKASEHDSAIEMVFADNGIGIAPGDESKIFEPFFTRGKQSNNAGLGLNLVYNLVCNVLGGEIGLISDRNLTGTHISISLPLELTAGPSMIGTRPESGQRISQN